MKKHSIILLLFFLPLTVCFSQEKNENKTTVIADIDTIDIYEQFLLVIKFPSKSIKTSSSYEGGYFVSYYIPSDTVMFSVYPGKLAEEPFITGSNCIVTDSLLFENVFLERNGFCLHSGERFKNKIGFFKEKEFLVLSIIAKYEWVDASKVEKYDAVLNNIEIIIIE